MQQGVKQIDLVDYEQLEEAQSQNQAEHQNAPQIPKSQASGSFVFQLDSPKQKNLQLIVGQDKVKTDEPNQIQTKEVQVKSQLTPIAYQIQLASQQSEVQRKQIKQTKEIKKENFTNNQKTTSNDQNLQVKNEKHIDKVMQDQREDRMKRRKKKSTFKDILDRSQVTSQNSKAIERVQSKNQLKNIEYARPQQHSNYNSQIQNQRTDIPLKQEPLTVNQRIEGMKQQNPKEIKQSKQLPPLKAQRTKKQQQQSNFLYNDSSIMALDKFTDIKHKNQNVVPASYQQGIFNHFAFKPILSGSKVKFLFKRQKNCMTNYYHPEYFLIFNLNKVVFSARKEWGNINSHYNISCEERNYAKTGKYYAGYLKGNFTGTCFNLFSCNDLASELVATIIYKAELSCIQQNYRQFQVYIKSQDYAYSQLAGNQQGQTIDLKELYELSDNARARKIIKLVNKQAEWCQSRNAFVMDFRGKLKMPSVKNMILVEAGRQHQNVLMLCKEQPHQFYLQVSYPLDPFLAMGIILSSFDFKLFCQ